MSKDFAWQLFKNTGNLDAFMIMRDIETSEEVTPIINAKGEKNGDCKDKRDCH